VDKKDTFLENVPKEVKVQGLVVQVGPEVVLVVLVVVPVVLVLVSLCVIIVDRLVTSVASAHRKEEEEIGEVLAVVVVQKDRTVPTKH